MKFGHAAAVAFLLAPIPFAGMTGPAVAAPVHIITVKVELVAVDGYPFVDAEKINRQRNITLEHGKPTGTVTFTSCADGAIAVLKVRASLRSNETVSVRPNLLLYDGPPCNSNDIAGTFWPPSRVIAGGRGNIGWEMSVDSGKFASADYAQAFINVTHNLWP